MNRPTDWEYCAEVIRVIDGDTIDVSIIWDIGFQIVCGTDQRIRLAHIDAPELRRGDAEHRAAGKAATEFLKEKLPVGTMVTLLTKKDPDAFGRYIADVILDGVNINTLLVKEGHAVYRDY